jgi:hypothetical protein
VSVKIERRKKVRAPKRKMGFFHLLLFSFYPKVGIGCISALGLSGYLALLFSTTYLLIVNFFRVAFAIGRTSY